MLRNLNQSSGGKRILGVPQIGILAAQIAAETATGDHGQGALYNEAIQAVYAGKYLRMRITSPFPEIGTLFVAENGQITATDLPNGTHVFGYDLDVDGFYDSSTSFSVAVGVVDAVADGATLTGTSSLDAGTADGEQNAVAPGVTLTGSSALEAGDAAGGSGGTDATAPGAALTGVSSLDAGSADGAQNVSAPGATLTGTSSLEAGEAVGDLDAVAPGVTLTGTSSLSAGNANAGGFIAPGPDCYRVRSVALSRRIAAAPRSFLVKK